jgi:hypothetical protein
VTIAAIAVSMQVAAEFSYRTGLISTTVGGLRYRPDDW